MAEGGRKYRSKRRLALRRWSGRTSRVNPGVEVVVQVHAGDTEQRQADPQRYDARVRQDTAQSTMPASVVGPHGRQDRQASESQGVSQQIAIGHEPFCERCSGPPPWSR